MIEGVRTYTETFGYHKPSGHLLTSALVESLYFIVSEQQRQQQQQFDKDDDNDDPVVSQLTLERAKSCASALLHRLALTVAAASRACEALQEVLSPDEIHHYDLVSSCRLGSDPITHIVEDEPSLPDDFWRMASEAAVKGYDGESTAPQRLATAEPQIGPRSLDGFVERVESENPFGEIVGGLDWDSLLSTLPSGRFSQSFLFS